VSPFDSKNHYGLKTMRSELKMLKMSNKPVE
jgi:hypothetical protein